MIFSYPVQPRFENFYLIIGYFGKQFFKKLHDCVLCTSLITQIFKTKSVQQRNIAVV